MAISHAAHVHDLIPLTIMFGFGCVSTMSNAGVLHEHALIDFRFDHFKNNDPEIHTC